MTNDRGERRFGRLPSLVARLYDRIARLEAVRRQQTEIAQDLVSRVAGGRLLDVGTGPGRLLAEIRRLDPSIQLCGLDVSASMVQLAKQNLAGIPADIRQGNIEKTEYESDSFDGVTCTGSFYLWNRPEACLDEVHRILKNGRSAYLYESYRDFDAEAVWQAVRNNLRCENFLCRLLMPHFLKRQLAMTYRIDEYAAIIDRTKFAGSYAIDKIVLAGLPAWVRITLTK